MPLRYVAAFAAIFAAFARFAIDAALFSRELRCYAPPSLRLIIIVTYHYDIHRLFFFLFDIVAY